jgi:hypothetical protein
MGNSVNAGTAARRGRGTLVTEKSALCLSCEHAIVRLPSERDGLVIKCTRGRTSGVDCPEHESDGTEPLMRAIVKSMRKTQTGYRKVFNVIQPDCPNCTASCCTQPFLNKTPFFGEDAIYYLLIGRPLPIIPKGTDHCVFFSKGCTLEPHLRPHVCIEYKCPFIENPPQIDRLGDRLERDTIYLIAVASKEYTEWRGTYDETDAAGRKTGATVDRFGERYDPKDPAADLYLRYGVAPPTGRPGVSGRPGTSSVVRRRS